MPAFPQVRVVVRIPSNRAEHSLSDPPKIEWTAEKADILWKVIEKSRTNDNAGADWKGLAAHLEVPLPYLLYRVHARFQEELRGLQVINGVPAIPSPPKMVNFPASMATRTLVKISGSTGLSASSKLSSPVGIRARLNSLGHNSLRPRKATSSSTITVQGQKRPHTPLQPPSHPTSSDASDSDEEDAEKEEEADREADEQYSLDQKLVGLQKMMTNEALGLVSSGRKFTGAAIDTRGRKAPLSTLDSFRRNDDLSSRSTSQSLSSASSPQGSIPDIPSPQPQSPLRRDMSHSKSSSPPAMSPRSAVGQRYGPLVARSTSEQDSNHGSSASSFSDLSDASLSGSALESALLSNIRGNGSRLSTFTRSRFVSRTTPR